MPSTTHFTPASRAVTVAAALAGLAAAAPLRAQSTCMFDVEIKTSFLNTWQRQNCVASATVPASLPYHVYYKPNAQPAPAPVTQVLLQGWAYVSPTFPGAAEYRADLTSGAAGSQRWLRFVTTFADSSKRTDSLFVSVPAPPPPAPVAQVVVSPSIATLYIDGTDAAQLTATTKDASGTVLTGRAVTWASSDATVAAVTSGGYVTAMRAGVVTIRATSEGQTGAAQVTVKAPKLTTSGSRLTPLER